MLENNFKTKIFSVNLFYDINFTSRVEDHAIIYLFQIMLWWDLTPGELLFWSTLPRKTSLIRYVCRLVELLSQY